MADDKKKYNHMENVFQYLNKNYVSLDENLIKKNNVVLKSIVESIITKMKDKDVLFRSLYRTIFYGGSYYDGLKVGKPEEYDLDLLMELPKYAEPTITLSDIPGFVRLQLPQLEKFEKQPEYKSKYSALPQLLDKDNYLCTDKVLPWVEGLIKRALNEFPESGNVYIFQVDSKKYYGKICKGGPAFTLKINGDDPLDCIDIDLVPCFVLTDNKWPQGKFRRNLCETKTEFFIVPKAPKGDSSESNKEKKCWRLSFQEQEKVLMNNKGVLKPSLKLLKKLRDQLNHKSISSYYIKTVFLWQTEKHDESFWAQTLSALYITMLKEYTACLEARNIPYFWNKTFNLLGNINPITLTNVANKLKNIIAEIERNHTDSYIGAKELLTKEEFEKLKQDVPMSKKHINRQLSAVSVSPIVQGQPKIEKSISFDNSVSVSENQQSNDANMIAVAKEEFEKVKQDVSIIKNQLNFAVSTSPIIQMQSRSENFANVDNSTDVSEIDGKNDNGEMSKILAAINTQQQAIDNLTRAVSAMQTEQRNTITILERLENKMDDFQCSLSSLKDGMALQHKLNQTNKPDDLDLLLFDHLQPTVQYLNNDQSFLT